MYTDQDAVIKSLKQQIASLQSRSSETASLRKGIAALTAANSKLASENKTLSASLATAQNENKTVTAKLAQARSSAPPETKSAQGNSKQQQRSVILPGSAEAQREAQVSRLKEQLYGDLTGLMIRGIKKGEDGEDVYDCLQTGRNGSKYLVPIRPFVVSAMADAKVTIALHFHFTIPADDPDTPFDEVEFGYVPLLDEKRDGDLFDILPDYATDNEGISFPRAHAAKFYYKIVECMTKKIVTETEDD
jgi:regulator of replication initiation timing